MKATESPTCRAGVRRWRHSFLELAGWIICVTCIAACGGDDAAASQDPCEPVLIAPTADSFKDALSISYTVDFGEGDWCVPARNHDASIPAAFAVELRPADTQNSRTVLLEAPLFFEAVDNRSVEGKTSPLGGVWVLGAATGGPVYEVVKGKYQLLLKYRTEDCANEWLEASCAAWSREFALEDSISFVRETGR